MLAAEASHASRAAVVLLLVGIGYIAVADLRLSAAVMGIVALAASAAIAASYPRFALSAAFAIVLIAGTKLRIRDASDTLEGALDLQIIGELALYAIVGAGVAAICWTEGLFHGAPAEAGAYRVGRADRPGGAYRTGRLRVQAELTRTEKIILAYAALAVLSTAWSAAAALTLVRAAQLVTVALLAIAAVRVFGESLALWTACASVALYVLMCACLAATTPFAAPTYESIEGYRFSWFSIHPIQAGTFAAIGTLGLLSAALLTRRRLLGVPPLFYVAALGAVLVLTNSRGPLLACLAGAAVLVLLQIEARTRTALVLTGGTLAGACVAFGPDLMRWFSDLANQDSALARLLFRGETADTLLALNGRLDLWDTVRPSIAAHPLLGYGYQASRAIVLDAADWAAYAHNALLQTVLDLGIVGTIALLSIIVIGLVGFARGLQRGWTHATLGALLVFLLLNSISTESFAGAPGFETLALFICVLAAWPRDMEVIEL
jgi:O-antigen ligase